MSQLATLDAGAITSIGNDISAVAVFTISQSDINKVFRYEADSWDVNDISSTDVKYFTYMSQWPTTLQINPANAMLDKAQSSGAVLQVGIPNKMLVKHDFVRYLALKLFNTAQGVDLFNNESALLTNMNTIGAQSFQDISSNMWKNDAGKTANGSTLFLDVSSGFVATTNDYTTNDNICRELFQQILATNPSRFNSITLDTNGQAAVPILAGDSISYKFTVFPAANQNNLTGVPAFGGRVYQIKLLIDAGTSAEAAAKNTTTVD
jgi:hypothetical protein